MEALGEALTPDICTQSIFVPHDVNLKLEAVHICKTSPC